MIRRYISILLSVIMVAASPNISALAVYAASDQDNPVTLESEAGEEFTGIEDADKNASETEAGTAEAEERETTVPEEEETTEGPLSLTDDTLDVSVGVEADREDAIPSGAELKVVQIPVEEDSLSANLLDPGSGDMLYDLLSEEEAGIGVVDATGGEEMALDHISHDENSIGAGELESIIQDNASECSSDPMLTVVIPLNISLVKDGEEIQPEGSVKVRLAIPENADRDTLGVYHTDAAGNSERMQGEIEGDDYVFTTDGFSRYTYAFTPTATDRDAGNAISSGATLDGNLFVVNSNQSVENLTINGNSSSPTVIFICSGKTLTVTGSSGGSYTGGRAAIKLPSGKVLMLRGSGTLRATGGNGGGAGNGSNGGKASGGNHLISGTGGGGGTGAGGGGAGIGSDGTNGGSGGAGGASVNGETGSDSYSKNGKDGGSGENSAMSASVGDLYILDKVSVYAYGGNGGGAGTSAGSRGGDAEYKKNALCKKHYAGGGGGGGAGGEGAKGASIGTGGSGGGGGGAGGSGGLSKSSGDAPRGGGGKGGSVGGATANHSRTKEGGKSGGSGGNGGSRSSVNYAGGSVFLAQTAYCASPVANGAAAAYLRTNFESTKNSYTRVWLDLNKPTDALNTPEFATTVKKSDDNRWYIEYQYYTVYTGTRASEVKATLAGYSLDGWYNSASGGQKVISADGFLQGSVSGWTDSSRRFVNLQDGGEATLYAHWNALTYKISSVDFTSNDNVNGLYPSLHFYVSSDKANSKDAKDYAFAYSTNMKGVLRMENSEDPDPKVGAGPYMDAFEEIIISGYAGTDQSKIDFSNVIPAESDKRYFSAPGRINFDQSSNPEKRLIYRSTVAKNRSSEAKAAFSRTFTFEMPDVSTSDKTNWGTGVTGVKEPAIEHNAYHAVIEGDVTQGQTLFAHLENQNEVISKNSNYFQAADDPGKGTDVPVMYTWYVGGSVRGMGREYTITDEDIGKNVKVLATGVGNAFSGSINSAEVGPVMANAPTVDKVFRYIYSNGASLRIRENADDESKTYVEFLNTKTDEYEEVYTTDELKRTVTLTQVTGGNLSEWTIVGGFKEVDYLGDTSILMEGGTVKYIYGAGQDAKITGNTDITIKGGTVLKDVYGAGQNERAVLTGDTGVTITGNGLVKGNVYGGGYEANVDGNAYVRLHGGTVTGTVFGDGNRETEQTVIDDTGSASQVAKEESIVSGTKTVYASGSPKAKVDMASLAAKTAPSNTGTEQVVVLDNVLTEGADLTALCSTPLSYDANGQINLCYAANSKVAEGSSKYVEVDSLAVPVHVTDNSNYVVLDNSYKIKFDLAGGISSEQGPVRLEPSGGNYSLPESFPVPYKDGAVFTGFYYGRSSENDGTMYYDRNGARTGSNAAWKSEGDVLLTAVWQPLYSVEIKEGTDAEEVFYIASADAEEAKLSAVIDQKNVDVTDYSWAVNGTAASITSANAKVTGGSSLNLATDKVNIVSATVKNTYQSASKSVIVYIYSDTKTKAGAEAEIAAFKGSRLTINCEEGTYIGKTTVNVENTDCTKLEVMKGSNDITTSAAEKNENSAVVTLSLESGENSANFTLTAYSKDGNYKEVRTYVLTRVELQDLTGGSVLYAPDKSHVLMDRLFFKSKDTGKTTVYTLDELALSGSGPLSITHEFTDTEPGETPLSARFNPEYDEAKGAFTVTGAAVGSYKLTVTLENEDPDVVYVDAAVDDAAKTGTYTVQSLGQVTTPSMKIGKAFIESGVQMTYTSPVTGEFSSVIAGDAEAVPALYYKFAKEGSAGYGDLNGSNPPGGDWIKFTGAAQYKFNDSGKIFVKAICDGYSDSPVYYAEVLLKVIRIDTTADYGVYSTDETYGTKDNIVLISGQYDPDAIEFRVTAYDENWYTDNCAKWTEDELKSRFYFNWHYGTSPDEVVNGASPEATVWTGTKSEQNLRASSVLRIPATLTNESQGSVTYYFVCDVLSTSGAAPVFTKNMEVKVLPVAAEPVLDTTASEIADKGVTYTDRDIVFTTTTANASIRYKLTYTDLTGQKTVNDETDTVTTPPVVRAGEHPGTYEYEVYTKAEGFGDSPHVKFTFYAESGDLSVTGQPVFDNNYAVLIYSDYDSFSEDIRSLKEKAKLTLKETSTPVTLKWVEAVSADDYERFRNKLAEDRRTTLESYMAETSEHGLTDMSVEDPSFVKTITLNNGDSGTWDFVFPIGRDAGRYYFFGYAFCSEKPGIPALITNCVQIEVGKKDIMEIKPVPSVSIPDFMVDGEIFTPEVTNNHSGGDVIFYHKLASQSDAFYQPGTCPELTVENIGSYTLRADIAETANYLGCSIFTTYEIMDWMYRRVEEDRRFIIGDEAYGRAEEVKQDSNYDVQKISEVDGDHNVGDAVVSGPPIMMTVDADRSNIEYKVSEEPLERVELSVADGKVKVTSEKSVLTPAKVADLENELNTLGVVENGYLKDISQEEVDVVRGAMGTQYGYDYEEQTDETGIVTRTYVFSDYERDDEGHRIPIETAFSLTEPGTADVWVVKRDEEGKILYDEDDVPLTEEVVYKYTTDVERETEINSVFTLAEGTRITFSETAKVNGGTYRNAEGATDTQIINNGILSNITLSDGAVLAGTGTVENIRAEKGTLVRNNTLVGDILGGGTLQNVFIAEDAVVTGMVLRGKISNEGTLVNCVLEEGAVVVGGYVFKSMTSQGTLKGVTVVDGGEVDGGTLAASTLSGVLKNAVIKDGVTCTSGAVLEDVTVSEGARLDGGLIYGENNVNKGNITGAVITEEAKVTGGSYGKVDCCGELRSPELVTDELIIRLGGKADFDYEGNVNANEIINYGSLTVSKGSVFVGTLTNDGTFVNDEGANLYMEGILDTSTDVTNNGLIAGGKKAVFHNEGLTLNNEKGTLDILVENEEGTVKGGTLSDNCLINKGTIRDSIDNKGFLNENYLILDGPFVNTGTIYHPVVDPAYDVHDIDNKGHIIFLVQFDLMGHALDQQPEDQDVELDQKITDPGVLTEQYYTFMGWYRDTYAIDYWKIDSRPVIENTILYAEWTGEGRYTLRYYANGGDDSPLDEKTYLKGEEVIVNTTAPPVREDYVFRGWAVNLEDINPTYPAGETSTFIMPAHNVVLYAVWITKAASEIEVPEITRHPDDRYVRQGGSCEAISVTAKVTDGGNLSYQWYVNSKPSPEGAAPILNSVSSNYVPDTSKVGTSYYYCVVTNRHSDKPQEDAFQSSASNFCSVSVYSTEEGGQRYTVTFDTVVPEATKVSPYTDIVPGSVILEPAIPERTGFAFRGWYKDRSTTDTNKWDFAKDTVSADTVLYAGWDTKLLVTYNGNGGVIKPTSAPSVYVRYEDRAPVLPMDKYSVTNGNYSLSGWFRDPLCTIPWDFDKDVVRNDVVLYAGWGFSAGVETGSAEMRVAAVPDQYYTGKKITPEVTITDKGRVLHRGVDYTVWYKNNRKVSTGAVNNGLLLDEGGSIYYSQEFSRKKPTIVIRGIGNYKQTIYMNFNILPLTLGTEGTDIVAPEVTADICTEYAVTGKAIKPDVKIYYKGKKLRNKNDYQLSLFAVDVKENGNEVREGTQMVKCRIDAGMTGTFLMKVSGRGSYCDGFEEVITVGEGSTDLSRAKIKVSKLVYTGKELQLEDIPVTVKVGRNELTRGTDYELAFGPDYVKSGSRMSAGIYPVKILGTGNYKGSRMFSVLVKGPSVKSGRMTLSGNKVTYDGSYHGDMDLKVMYKVASDAEAAYLGAAKGQTVELRKGADYEVSVLGGVNAGKTKVTITGCGGFLDTNTAAYTIEPLAIDSPGITYTEDLGEIDSMGTAAMPDAEIYFRGSRLVRNVDYQLSYTGNKAPGSKAYVNVRGIGNFKGRLNGKITFTIKQKEEPETGTIDIKKAKFVIADQVYTGDEIGIYDESQFTKAVYKNKVLRFGVDYEIVEGSYSDNLNCAKNSSAAKASVMVRGIGEYTGYRKVKFRIVRKPVKWWIAE
ncbi:MAG: InlB B-repeat-containing protein [Lachnospiraceae bacterium]|nr:InlB B-repeat-containing protein [Lachnospiraceae bacterium]